MLVGSGSRQATTTAALRKGLAGRGFQQRKRLTRAIWTSSALSAKPGNVMDEERMNEVASLPESARRVADEDVQGLQAPDERRRGGEGRFLMARFLVRHLLDAREETVDDVSTLVRALLRPRDYQDGHERVGREWRTIYPLPLA